MMMAVQPDLTSLLDPLMMFRVRHRALTRKDEMLLLCARIGFNPPA
ncbi:hypothetical protein [Oleisolibacter albus]|nr:hypothetical protein [Oleisolibacter albus]